MARQTETPTQAIDQLWQQLARSRAVMLEVPGSGQHPQPMTHFADRDAGVIWFITSVETDLAKAVGDGAQAQMTLVTPKEDYQASLRGDLRLAQDSDKLDELWNPFAAAWFADGREDDSIRLLRFTPDEAAVWASEANAILVGLKLMRAKLTDGDETPDVGVHHMLQFDKVA